jgi:hypothetical protein
MSATSHSALALATLTIGEISGAFNVTTVALIVDTTPDAFSFTAQTGAALSALTTSNGVIVGGINAPASIIIAGGQYSIDAGPYTSGAGYVSNGQTVTVQVTSAASFSTPAVVTLTVGGVIGAFTVTTEPIDTTPSAFSFTPQVDVAFSVLRTSNSVTVSGINAPTPLSIVGGQYRIDAGPYTSSPGTISNGQSVTIQLTSPSALGMTAVATLTVGGISGAFTVSTEAIDTIPAAFSFVTRVNVRPNDNRRSEPTIITGFNSPAVITVSGPMAMYNINGGEFTAAPGVVNNGDAIRAHHRSSGLPNGQAVSTVTIGGVSGTFTTLSCGTWWSSGCGVRPSSD